MYFVERDYQPTHWFLIIKCLKVLERHEIQQQWAGTKSQSNAVPAYENPFSLKRDFYYYFFHWNPIKALGRRDYFVLKPSVMIGVPVVKTMKHWSACNLSGLRHQFGAIPNSLELLRHWKLPLWETQEDNCQTRTAHLKDSGKCGINTCSEPSRQRRPSPCPLSQTLTYSSSPCGIRMFISELLALTMSQSRESLLR